MILLGIVEAINELNVCCGA